ncbi:SulP family inorganic anion transporter [Candidimonas sp. SYP-B2681]|uniref:SulP family inorganic anion transporter n=1 Tax=Candidimonas sp. SYP-B2681 TaxID=2497686 RepID=UPI000F896EE6|nr:SulP family inorganic anion transporter [Candidimonas sp. SYP-B2681]RTZ41623.1 SulP family inorganic anion transporter [Candidimonas sp. SYP-B2681]
MSDFNTSSLKTNVLSGLTVSLALVPEAIAFALVAHVSPLTGLYAAFIVCLITAALGGRPGMISGAAGALAVVMVALVTQHGAEYLFAAVVLMGLLQLFFAACKLGKLIRMVPHSVMLGFVNGLAIVIFMAQFGHFKSLGADGDMHWVGSESLAIMLGLIAVTMAIIYLLPKLTTAIPSALAAILVVAGLVAAFGIDTKTVGDMGSIAGGLPQFHVPNVPLNLETLYIIFPYALILAAIGLIETLLTLNLIDEMTDTRGKPNRESMAQGLANVVGGFFATMGGCAMIGQSMININNGARHRISGIAAAVFLLGFILFLSSWIELIPLAALIGLMFVVAQKTFAWGSLRALRKIPRQDAIIVIGVTVITVLTDLAVAVLAGIVFAALVFAWQQAKQIQANTFIDNNGMKVYQLRGVLFFASAANFSRLFTPNEDPSHVVLEFAEARVVDHSAVEAIDSLANRYQQAGKTLHLRHLSADCLELLSKAKDMVEIDVYADPHYHIADSKLG